MGKIIYFIFLPILLYGMIPSTLTQNFEIPSVINVEINKPKGSCNQSVTIVNGIPIHCADELIFQEEFEGSTLHPYKWTVERRIPRSPDYEFNLYIDDIEDVLKVENGLVHIKPTSTTGYFGITSVSKREPIDLGPTCTGELDSDECFSHSIPPYISAQFSSKDKFSFKYGRVEVRAKMPQGMWIYPQLWLQPNCPKYGYTNYNSGQMRLAQTRDDGPRKDLITGLVLNSAPAWHYLLLCINSTHQNVSDEFHVYEMSWTPQAIVFSMDDEEFCRDEVNSEAGSKWAPFDQEFYLLVGEGIGGLSDFHDGH
ncbi:gram-negative bacteria-binding protein 3-like [Musca vetustissima]|uniref:gram-negative bacteria-binding protein 3-like n=1 Tax=Musca vetustissima TaxID=27455 RepID=UPI002AB74D9F|nr:gram-negative bacteria-binding protein 3-like [Musca vetustissima]